MTSGTDGAGHPRKTLVTLAVALLVGTAGCVRSNDPASGRSPSVLRIGFGLTTGADAQAGIRQVAMNIALEGLLTFGADGRPAVRLAERWESSADGLTLRIRLRPGVRFHDGSPLTAAAMRDILSEQLPPSIGPAFEDVKQIRVRSDNEVEFLLNRRSNFVLEGLDALIRAPGNSRVGTGPFYAVETSGDQAEMHANKEYYRGAPLIDRIVIEPYGSVRSAWADMLRGRVDMLFEVGVDAVDLLQSSRDVEIFTFPRAYASIVILNVERPQLRDAAFRRALNAAVDRQALVDDVLNGHGTPAEGPVWPHHWAYDEAVPRFRYEPRAVTSSVGRPRFTLLYTEPSHERVALVLQRQLRAVGVDVALETAPLDQALARARNGDFEAFLADAVHGPTLLRPYLFWHSDSPLNWGRFSSRQVDAALDLIRGARDDAAYKSGVAAFQGAIVNDPPAIFLTWGERTRAVSTRFEVPVEPGRDILSTTLRLWRPVTDSKAMSPN